MTEAASRYCHREGRSVDAMWCAKSPVLNLKTLDYANKTCKVWLILKPLVHITYFIIQILLSSKQHVQFLDSIRFNLFLYSSTLSLRRLRAKTSYIKSFILWNISLFPLFKFRQQAFLYILPRCNTRTK